jgi:hypothetical protein
MTAPSKPPNISALAERARNQPETISEDEIRVLGEYAHRYHQQATKGKRKQEAIAGAEAFRRRIETVHIFRGLPQRLREHPAGLATINAVQARLKEIGIMCSETTLLRDYKKIGGAAQLRNARPFEPGEDRLPIISREAVSAAKAD